MYWFRNEDGSRSYGSINLGRSNDPSEYLIEFPDKIRLRKDYIIKNIEFSQFSTDDVYMFLYGHTGKEFITLVSTRSYKIPKLKEWNSDIIRNTNINLFLVAFIVFIDSNSDFDSKFWKTIKTIFLLLINQDESFFEEIASYYNCSADEFLEWFDNFVSNEIINKILTYRKEEICFKCYTALCEAKDVLLPLAYEELEERCCEFFDEIAKKRVGDEFSLPRDLDKIITFSIDNVFFYKDYFKLKHANPETIEHINDATTFLYIGIAKILINHKCYLEAQKFLEDAKEIYVTKVQLTNIIEIEYSIKKQVQKLQKRKERKETAAHNKRCKLLYRSINKKFVKFILPGGIKQLDCIMKSLFKLIDKKFDDYQLDYHQEVLSLYSDVWVRMASNPDNMRYTIYTLKKKHPDIIKTDDLSAAVVVFTSSNMVNNQYEIVTNDDLCEIKEISKMFLEEQAVEKDTKGGKSQSADAEYGLVATKPIYTTNIKSSHEYLGHLRSLSGERYRWKCLDSTSVEGIDGMVDMYEGTLSSGEKSSTVYISMYGSEISHSAPIGFMYVD